MKIVRTRRGARLVEGEVTLSEMRSTPGPTHSLFDVLAACVAALAPGPRFALLGFCGGGMIAPLRAMGYRHGIDTVDLSREGEKIFRELSGDWAGTVRLTQADAERWLRRRGAKFDVIVEDLSVHSEAAGTVKPYVSLDTLPALIHDRLRPGGVAIVNVLPLLGTSWQSLLWRIAHPHRRALVLTLEEYENRFVIAGDELEPAARVSQEIRAALRDLGSNQADKIAVRTLFRGK